MPVAQFQGSITLHMNPVPNSPPITAAANPTSISFDGALFTTTSILDWKPTVDSNSSDYLSAITFYLLSRLGWSQIDNSPLGSSANTVDAANPVIYNNQLYHTGVQLSSDDCVGGIIATLPAITNSATAAHWLAARSVVSPPTAMGDAFGIHRTRMFTYNGQPAFLWLTNFDSVSGWLLAGGIYGPRVSVSSSIYEIFASLVIPDFTTNINHILAPLSGLLSTVQLATPTSFNVLSSEALTFDAHGVSLGLNSNDWRFATRFGYLANHSGLQYVISKDGTKYWTFDIQGGTVTILNASVGADSTVYLYDDSGVAYFSSEFIAPIVAPLQIFCNTPPPAQLGVAYSHTITADGGFPPYAFGITAGSLPPGLTLNSTTGVISGMLTHSALQGSYGFTVAVVDTLPESASVNCSIGVPVGFRPMHNIWESGLARGSELSATMIRLAAFDIWARGAGPLVNTVYGPDKVLSQTPQLLLASGVPATVLTPNPGIMYALKLDFRQIENFSIRFETNTIDAWLELSGFRTYIKSDLYNR